MALRDFAHKEQVTITWKSFELDPTLKTSPGIDIYEYFANAKGVPRAQAIGMFENVTSAAAEVGLDFQLDKSIVANSFMAHRLIQLAKTRGLGDEIEEVLFRLHFIEGKNIDDKATLSSAADEVNIPVEDVDQLFRSSDFEAEVRIDQLEAQQIGIRGVPFFVFDDKYAVSGAQPTTLFLQTLQKAWETADHG